MRGKFTHLMKPILAHNLPSEFQLTNVMETDIGNYFFYGNIVVVEAKEGIDLSYKQNISILLNTLNITENKPWCYISNRINSYSIRPLDYKYLNKIPTLKALGLVNYNNIGRANNFLEAKFFKKPFEVFNNLTEAVIWGKSFL